MRALLFVLAVVLAGCGSPPGSVSFYLKDHGEEQFSELHVVVAEVRLEGERPVTLVADGAIDVELLRTQGPYAAFIGEMPAAGPYEAIYVRFSEAYGYDHHGNWQAVRLEPGEFTLKKPLDPGTGELRLTIDLDVVNGLRPSATGWRLVPIIGQVVTAQVADHLSGRQVHAPGQTVELDELKELGA